MTGLFHFLFAECYNPDNLNFGTLRVLNNGSVKPGTGFDTHPCGIYHRDFCCSLYDKQAVSLHFYGHSSLQKDQQR
jgi:hypothetical protein